MTLAIPWGLVIILSLDILFAHFHLSHHYLFPHCVPNLHFLCPNYLTFSLLSPILREICSPGVLVLPHPSGQPTCPGVMASLPSLSSYTLNLECRAANITFALLNRWSQAH